MTAKVAASADLVAYSRDIIGSGSKSFAAASMVFDRRTRASAHLLYAWCRHCDDEADGQSLGHDAVVLTQEEQRARVDALYVQTRAALAGHDVEQPVFRALQAVAVSHDLPSAYPFDHLRGFRLDADRVRFRTLEDLLIYCYHVAGVVGVMMAWIMGIRDAQVLDRACDLGIAFQLTNIARDVVDDAAVGRVYLPETWLAEADVPVDAVAAAEHRADVHALAVRLIELAEPYYASARWGMVHLPFRSAWAIESARGVYREIGRKLVRQGPSAWNDRLSTTSAEKMGHLVRGGGSAAYGIPVDRGRGAPPRTGLWTRPGGGLHADERPGRAPFTSDEAVERQQAF